MDCVAHQASLSMGFSRQEYLNELLFPPPGKLPDPGIEPDSSEMKVDSLPLGPLRNALLTSVKQILFSVRESREYSI